LTSKTPYRNPFRVRQGEFWADRERLWENLMDYVDLARMTRSNEIIVLVGDYGCGTTHTLRYLEKNLKNKGAFVSYFTAPVKGALNSFYKGLLEDIPADERKIIIEQLIDEAVINPDEIRNIPFEDLESTIFSSISGGKLSYRQLRMLENVGLYERLPSASEIWGKIVSDLATSEWPVFILIDEFDAALLDPFEAQELLFDFRRLYDDALSRMCVIIGLKGEPKDVRKKLGDAIFSRMTLQPIYINPLSQREALDFMKGVLKHSRREKKDQLFPFTEKSAKALIDFISPCTPRRLLRIASVIYEEARRRNRERISTDFVNEIVTKFGQISIFPSLPEVVEPETKRKQKMPSIIEYSSNGSPNILVDPSKLTAKETISLVLFAKYPSSLTMREILNLVTKNWKSVKVEYVGANLAQMKSLVIREGKKGSYRYKLSGLGESWVKDELIPKLSGKTPKTENILGSDGRGGQRKAFISPKIDELIQEGFFNLPNKRTADDVLNGLLEKKGIPIKGKEKAVLSALKRRLGKTLFGTRENGKWVFWTE